MKVNLLPMQSGTRYAIDQFFNEALGANAAPLAAGGRAPLAVWEDSDKVNVEWELPGVASDDLDIVVHEGKLRLTATRKAPEEERRYWRNEFRYGQFERTIALPETIDEESVTATLNDGILRVTLAKKPEAQPRKIEVKTS